VNIIFINKLRKTFSEVWASACAYADRSKSRNF